MTLTYSSRFNFIKWKAKSSLRLIKRHIMRVCGEEKVQLHAFLISVLDEDEWLVSQDGALDKNRTMDNIQKHNICTNVPSSQTFTSY
jgi:hypothetical protein